MVQSLWAAYKFLYRSFNLRAFMKQHYFHKVLSSCHTILVQANV